MSLIQLDHIQKDYTTSLESVHALNGISLRIHSGEFSAIAGPSGSGKTTLLNLIGGLDHATSGSILLEGKELTTLSSSELSKVRLNEIGFIFQSYNLIPVLSAAENVEFIMELQGVDPTIRRQKALNILERVGLGGYADRRPAKMSGGQQQRVAVARAIVSKPKIVLADEPTANLDSETAAKLLDLMKELNEKEGITFLFSTHDPMVMSYAKRLIKLHDGKIISDETK